MKRILLYENRKIDPIAFDATGDKQRDAFYALFTYLDENWKVYGDLTNENNQQSRFYHSAKAGDKDSAARLLAARRAYEYDRRVQSKWRKVSIHRLASPKLFRGRFPRITSLRMNCLTERQWLWRDPRNPGRGTYLN